MKEPLQTKLDEITKKCRRLLKRAEHNLVADVQSLILSYVLTTRASRICATVNIKFLITLSASTASTVVALAADLIRILKADIICVDCTSN